MGIKKGMKRWISLLLAGTICVNIGLSVYAANENTESSIPEAVMGTVAPENDTEENETISDEVVQDSILGSDEEIGSFSDNEASRSEDGELQDSSGDQNQDTNFVDKNTVGTGDDKTLDVKLEDVNGDTEVKEQDVDDESGEKDLEPETDLAKEGRAATTTASPFKIEGTVLKEYTGTGGAVTIPNNVTEIAGWAFSNKGGITSVQIPGNVKKIGSYAFNGCYGITSVTISSGVVEIGESAFRECTALRNINIPGSVVSIGYSAFSGCTSLGRITINSGVQTIGASAFRGNQITAVSIPDSVKEMGTSVFADCKDLQSVVLGSGLIELQNSSFEGCSSLTSISMNSVKTVGNYAFKNCISLPSIKLPNTVESVGYEAFRGDASLNTLQLGTNVGIIGDYCFKGCNSLADIQWNSKVYSIGYQAFYGTAISALTLPNSVTEVGNGAFEDCSSLKSATIGTGITAISNSMFENCISLEKVVINGLVTNISNYAFKKCISLTSINIPDSVTKLGYEAFRNCTSLSAIRLGNGITMIDGYALSYCSSLKTIYMPFYLSEWGSNILYGCTEVTAYIYRGANKAIQWAKESGVNYKVIGDFKPNAVTGLRAVASGKKRVTLTWNESVGAEGYLIYAQKNGKYGYVGYTESGTTFPDLRALDTAYNFYWVFPYIWKNSTERIIGGTPQYVYAKGITAAVTNLKASSVKGGVRLTWNASNGADGYLIYGQVGGNKYGYVGMATKGTTYTDNKASKSVWNFYWVFPYHIGDNGKMVVGGTPKYVYGRAQ